MINYFQLLDLKQQYDIDQTLLQKQYLSMQAKYHPDRARTTEDKNKAMDVAMQLNEAYKILGDDYLRAEYLLKLLGVKLDDETMKKATSPAKLEDIWQQFALIDETEDISQLQQMLAEKNQEKQILINNLSKAFQTNKLQEALDFTVNLKYLTNLVGNIELRINSNANS